MDFVFLVVFRNEIGKISFNEVSDAFTVSFDVVLDIIICRARLIRTESDEEKTET